MIDTILNHTPSEVKHALKDNSVKVYWTNTLLNTKWEVVDVRTRLGQLHVRVQHPIFAGWYAVDSKDKLSYQVDRARDC